MANKPITKSRLITRSDIILISCLVIIAVLLFIFFLPKTVSSDSSPAAYANISIDGEHEHTIDMTQNAPWQIETDYGIYTGSIIDGEIGIETAPCPDKTCIHMGHIGTNGEVIVCLPGELIIEIINQDQDDDVPDSII